MMAQCATSDIMLDGEISKLFIILQRAAQGCTLSSIPFKILMNDVRIGIEPAKQEVKVGRDTVSGSACANDFVRTSDVSQGLQKQIEKARGYTTKWRGTAKVNKCAVLARNGQKENPTEVKVHVRNCRS